VNPNSRLNPANPPPTGSTYNNFSGTNQSNPPAVGSTPANPTIPNGNQRSGATSGQAPNTAEGSRVIPGHKSQGTGGGTTLQNQNSGSGGSQ
jgi:hypothetical protein